jgi:hypothetical protein
MPPESDSPVGVFGGASGAATVLETAFTRQFARLWRPEPSNAPQLAAYRSKADLLLYGGAAGGGKTDLLIGLALEHARAVIFRRAYVDLKGIEQRLIEVVGSREGYNGNDRALRRPGCLIEFGALERPGSELSWQGRPHDFIGFDEGAQLDERNVRFVMGWLRSEDKDQRCRVVIASNPPIGGQGDWLVTWFAPWLDPAFPQPAQPGELRWRCMRADGSIAWVDGPGMHAIDGVMLQALSCTFIPARLSDNRFLRDTNYRAQLMALPEPLRSKLLEGDFLAGREDAANQVIPWDFIAAAQARWTPDGGRGVKMTTIGVDVAQGGADDTVLARLHGTWFDVPVRRRGIDTANGPLVAALVIEHVRDGAQINIDLTGGWGGSAYDHLLAQGFRAEPVVFSAAARGRTRDGQLTFLNVRAELLWTLREALDPRNGEASRCRPTSGSPRSSRRRPGGSRATRSRSRARRISASGSALRPTTPTRSHSPGTCAITRCAGRAEDGSRWDADWSPADGWECEMKRSKENVRMCGAQARARSCRDEREGRRGSSTPRRSCGSSRR